MAPSRGLTAPIHIGASNLAMPLRFGSSLLLVLLAVAGLRDTAAALDVNFYARTCPRAERIVSGAVAKAVRNDPRVSPRILRMFFHDCFVRGCDASVLLDSTPGNKAEKDGPPNVSLAAFYVIDNAKRRLEKACPRIVSCADIIAIAARDVVVLAGGPNWGVLKGRKDGRVSNANDTVNLPAPTFSASQLIQSFSSRGLSANDLVALSGGHTLGFSHCSSFNSRLRNFNSTNGVDPTLNSKFAATLQNQCPKLNTDRNAGQLLDSTATVFDNDYYKRIVKGMGVFSSDQGLYGDIRTKSTVDSFARNQTLFFQAFAAAMVRLGNVGVLETGEVRKNCRAVN